ncbi:MAG: NnrU family protein [Cohaesibacter sp.]|nr:NnrU family protein [Cohaesibacter sp.]MCV6601384.1 NnrU family protein [Cohaesibacter sp.]
MGFLVLGILLFLIIHLVPQFPDFKECFVGKIGLMGYRALHGVIALGSVVLIVHGYFESRYDPVFLWDPPFWTRHLVATLMIFSSILVFAAPFSGKIKEKLTSPLSVSLKLWALAHLVGNGTLADVVLFGFFLFFAVSYRISLKKRIVAGLVSVPQGRWLHDVYALVLGLGFYVIMVLWLHEWAFDVSPIS